MKKLFSLVAVIMLTGFWRTQAQLPVLELEGFAEGFSSPLGIENCGDSRLFIVERGGRIWILDEDGNKSSQSFLDISDRVLSGDEQGLLGLAFHPNYLANGYFYVNYTNLQGNTRISRFSVSPSNPDKALGNSERVLLKINQPFPNHNGGGLRFSPNDGYLYIGMGDGGDAGDPFELAQNPSVFLGKMLRIDVNTDVNSGQKYSIPPSNPFVDVPGYKPEIWALGLRNPFRWSFDRLTGDLWIADVGQNRYEEVNYQPAASNGGENYGWDCKEGQHTFQPWHCNPSDVLKDPIVEYPHENGDCTVIGGFVYRGSMFPNMYGKYFYNDFCSGKYRTVFQENGEWMNIEVLDEGEFEYVTFGEAKNGELYTADIEGGEILHIIDVSPMKTGQAISNLVSLYPNPNNGEFTIHWMASENQTCEIEIINLLGQQVVAQSTEATVGNNTWQSSVNHLSTGTYLLLIHAREGLIRQKFSIE